MLLSSSETAESVINRTVAMCYADGTRVERHGVFSIFAPGHRRFVRPNRPRERRVAANEKAPRRRFPAVWTATVRPIGAPVDAPWPSPDSGPRAVSSGARRRALGGRSTQAESLDQTLKNVGGIGDIRSWRDAAVPCRRRNEYTRARTEQRAQSDKLHISELRPRDRLQILQMAFDTPGRSEAGGDRRRNGRTT